jgi:hypothetical protein
MKESDFEKDSDSFPRELSRARIAHTRIKDMLFKHAEYWQELSPSFLGGHISVSCDSQEIAGEVAGKPFRISPLLIVIEGENYLLSIVSSLNPLTGDQNEVSRFLMDIHGSVLSIDREELISWQRGQLSYDLLVAIARRVLSYSYN